MYACVCVCGGVLDLTFWQHPAALGVTQFTNEDWSLARGFSSETMMRAWKWASKTFLKELSSACVPNGVFCYFSLILSRTVWILIWRTLLIVTGASREALSQGMDNLPQQISKCDPAKHEFLKKLNRNRKRIFKNLRIIVQIQDHFVYSKHRNNTLWWMCRLHPLVATSPFLHSTQLSLSMAIGKNPKVFFIHNPESLYG